MSPGLFIVGTDQQQGTSLVTLGLLLALQHRGFRVVALKPVELGCRPLGDDGDEGSHRALSRLEYLAGAPPRSPYHRLPPELLLPPVALALLDASALPLSLDAVNPFRYADPPTRDPLTAARLACRPIDLDQIAQNARALQEGADLLLVEGTGGPAAPLADARVQLDLIEHLALPVVLVVASEPGAVSRCLLTIETLKTRRLPLAGVVLNRTRSVLCHEEADYPLLIESFAGDVVLGFLPYFDETERADHAHLARRFSVHLHLDRLLSPRP